VSGRRRPPLLSRSELTGRVYIVTRYTDHGDGRITAHEKFDVTAQFVATALEFDEDWWNAHTEAAAGVADTDPTTTPGT
jgi:hypothetical protein